MDSATVDEFLTHLNYAKLQRDHEEFNTFAYAYPAAIQDQAQKHVEYLGYLSVNIVRKTMEKTSQLATTIFRFLI
jgi:hypothetical protein